MKTLKDLFEIMAEAAAENQASYRTWFIDYSGHVNHLEVKFYFTGWGADGSSPCERLNQKLNEDGIQVAYYWIKTRLGKNQ